MNCNSNLSLTGSGTEPPSAGGYGGLGSKPPAAGRFFVIFWKKKLSVNTIGSQFARIQSHLKVLYFWHLKANWKNKVVQSFFCLQFKSKTRSKSCILGLNFVSDLAHVGGSKVHCLLRYSSRKLQSTWKFSLDIIVLSWKQPVIGVHIRPGAPRRLNSKICSMSIPLTVANFFQRYFVALKLARWRWIAIKKCTIDGYAY